MTALADRDLRDLLEALEEPAAICELDGLITLSNTPWRGIAGEGAHVLAPCGTLYPAFRAALRAGRSEGEARLDGGAPRRVAIARMGEARFLLRLAATTPAPVQIPAPADPPDAPGEEASRREFQRRKMEAIGQLAGGVAHDFNNVLSSIGLRVEDLLARHPLGDPAYASLSEIHEGVNRAAALVFQLLTFSRQAPIKREVLDLGEALINLEVWLRRLLRETVTLHTDYAADAPLIHVDRGQLEMAVMNLVVNARDALKERGGGVIRLSAARVGQARAVALGCPVAPAGDLALIEVSDNGPGIPPEMIDRIFEPFFTTKALGEGTGLGLATVLGAVEQSGGWITAHSPPGEGARFRIFLPVHAPRLQLPPPPAPARPPPRDLSGHGRILFVEDEDAVRDIAARLLRAQGYEVMEARDGEEALALIQAHPGRIDLMISDVSMPGMDGPALLAAARPHLAGAPVLFISGYAESEFAALLEGETNVTFLPKPLQLPRLAEAVKARLAGGRG
jgi:two-component system cell cycle sensor histidine kinase/response regulator CckA